MREIYKTEAIILSGLPYRDGDKIFLVLSPSLGLCFVKAIGIRRLKSRLRYILQDLSLVELDLVKGRVGWKITNASLQKSWFGILRREKSFLKKIGAIKNLLFRMTDSDFELRDIFVNFNQVLDFYATLNKKEITENKLNALEMILLSKILHSLGYINADKWPIDVDFKELSDGLMSKVLGNKKFIYKEINRAIQESQL